MTYYDARNLPLKIDLLQTGIPTQTIAVQTRNVAGLVTKREIIFSDLKTFDDVVMPAHIREVHGGQLFFDCSVEYEFPKEIDSKEFVRP